ncbi:MAG: hypothetical protein C4288_10860 [Leptolyngbya sp. ERB_1_1]
MYICIPLLNKNSFLMSLFNTQACIFASGIPFLSQNLNPFPERPIYDLTQKPGNRLRQYQ